MGNVQTRLQMQMFFSKERMRAKARFILPYFHVYVMSEVLWLSAETIDYEFICYLFDRSYHVELLCLCKCECEVERRCTSSILLLCGQVGCALYLRAGVC